jgi:pimeloyl-ACP methyl ester carboxylesterase
MNPTLRLAAIVFTFAAALPAIVQNASAQDTGLLEEPVEVQVLSTARSLLGEITGHSGVGLLRESLWEDDDTARYGLHLDENWEKVAAAAPDRPLVVLIHGLNSSAESNAPILIPVRAAGYPAAVFAYPNDWDLTDSATFLSKHLKEFAAANPKTSVAIVTHSMGGLIARACVEDPTLDPGNVTRLVMIAPPSQGSLIAHVGFASDIWEHGIARRDGSAWRRLRDSVVDGLGEATADLVPGSPFLTRLNARERNPKVRYAIFLGTHAAVNQTELGLVRRLLATSIRSEGLGAYAESADTLVAEMEEVVEGKGDGVVAVKRGRLPGVDDVVEMPFDHISCTGEPGDDETILKLQSELVARLR